MRLLYQKVWHLFLPIYGSCFNFGRIHTPTRINLLHTIKKLDSTNSMMNWAVFFQTAIANFHITELALELYLEIYNHRIPQRALEHRTPI